MNKFNFFMLLLILITAGCAYQPVDTDTLITNNTTTELATANSDSIYIIRTKNYHYYYDNNKILLEKYPVNNIFIIIPWFVFLISLLFCILWGFILGILKTN
jgi:hypothetical protein